MVPITIEGPFKSLRSYVVQETMGKNQQFEVHHGNLGEGKPQVHGTWSSMAAVFIDNSMRSVTTPKILPQKECRTRIYSMYLALAKSAICPCSLLGINRLDQVTSNTSRMPSQSRTQIGQAQKF